MAVPDNHGHPGMTTVSLSIAQVFDIALKSYYAGKLAEAEQFCLKILSADPDSAATLNLLAVINASLGRNEEALANYDRALLLQPGLLTALNNRGAVLKAMKRYDEALDSYDRALVLQPDYAEVISNRASVLHELTRYDEALASYDRALALRPDYAEALNNRGTVLQALRRYAEALRDYDAALSLRHDFVEAFVNRGIVHYELGHFGEALASYDRAISLRPNNADALSNRGNVLGKLQRHDDALASYNAALNLQPHHIEALCNRGTTLRRLKRPEEALASYDRALALHPDHPGALVGRAGILHDRKQFADALNLYGRAIALRPDCTEALVNQGVALHELGRSGEALNCFERALASEPRNAEALTNRGVALHDLARYDELADNNSGGSLHKQRRLEQALASHDSALSARPDYAEALANRGVVLYDLRRFDEASASYDQAIALRPDYADAHFLKGLSSLIAGDFDRGWIEYEWRRVAPAARLTKRDFPQPAWLGEGNIAGRKLLLHSEQGFGDSIQFCRYVPLAAERGARIIMEVEEPLCELMSGLAGIVQVVAKGDSLPDFDIHCSLPSLPLAFQTRLATIPSNAPYLRVPKQALAYSNALLGATHAPRIGLAWSGNAKHVRDGERSMKLRDLLPLLDVGASFVSLQKEVRAGDRETLENSEILDLGRDLRDFADTAALISQLDLVISVDTSIAHLAGALGKPVWILLAHAPDWRWLLDRSDSPWYPTARLFRQSAARAWDGVIARVRDALLELTGKQRIAVVEPQAAEAVPEASRFTVG